MRTLAAVTMVAVLVVGASTTGRASCVPPKRFTTLTSGPPPLIQGIQIGAGEISGIKARIWQSDESTNIDTPGLCPLDAWLLPGAPGVVAVLGEINSEDCQWPAPCPVGELTILFERESPDGDNADLLVLRVAESNGIFDFGQIGGVNPWPFPAFPRAFFNDVELSGDGIATVDVRITDVRENFRGTLPSSSTIEAFNLYGHTTVIEPEPGRDASAWTFLAQVPNNNDDGLLTDFEIDCPPGHRVYLAAGVELFGGTGGPVSSRLVGRVDGAIVCGGSLSAGSVPDGARVPGAMLEVTQDELGDLELSWGVSCLASDTDYAVYEGDLGAFDSHVPRICTTAGLTSATVVPGPGSHYYLAVPQNSSHEGSHGTGSDGAQRVPGPVACQPQQHDSCVCAGPCADSTCTDYCLACCEPGPACPACPCDDPCDGPSCNGWDPCICDPCISVSCFNYCEACCDPGCEGCDGEVSGSPP